jgi:hypothetical protein
VHRLTPLEIVSGTTVTGLYAEWVSGVLIGIVQAWLSVSNLRSPNRMTGLGVVCVVSASFPNMLRNRRIRWHLLRRLRLHLPPYLHLKLRLQLSLRLGVLR